MDDQIAQFVSLTSSTPQEAQSYLTQAGGNLETAVGLFFAAADDGDDAGEEDQLMGDDDDDEEEAAAQALSHATPAATAARTGGGGGNSLGGGASEPLPAGWGQGGGGGSGARVGRVGQWGGPGGQGSTPARTGNGPRIATLGSINSSGPSAGGGRGGSPGGGDDDGSSDEEKGEDLYAGGERSGLNIQNPNKNKGPAGAGGGRGVVADILKKAQEAGPPPAPPGSSAGPSGSSAPSWGSGNTLGSDTTPSSSIADPNAPPPRSADDDEDEEDEETAVRHLTFWRDGFSIEDGELRRYDQPGNRELLEAINQGRAPPSLLNVRVNQPVEVRVAKRLEEDYQPAPPKPKGPWEGSGNRLGAPVPGLSSPPSSSAAAPASTAATEASSTTGTGSSAGGNLQFEVDMTEPTTQLQIRLGDGTRLVARVNFTHTIGDVRRFINASRPSSTRSYALQTTFPNKDLVDETQTIKEAGLGGAVVVQRWTT